MKAEIQYTHTNTKRSNHDAHYLDKSFEFYPCLCRFNKRLSTSLQNKCNDCMMSYSSRIRHMKSKI